MANGTERASSLDELEAAFNAEMQTDRRAAAETAYALAVRYRDEDVSAKRRFDIAGEWARRAIDILEQLPSETVEQVASSRRSVGGVELPDLLHDGVVRARLADVLI
jgi:hypothetical protein